MPYAMSDEAIFMLMTRNLPSTPEGKKRDLMIRVRDAADARIAARSK